jgi:hypothetical protein
MRSTPPRRVDGIRALTRSGNWRQRSGRNPHPKSHTIKSWPLEATTNMSMAVTTRRIPAALVRSLLADPSGGQASPGGPAPSRAAAWRGPSLRQWDLARAGRRGRGVRRWATGESVCESPLSASPEAAPRERSPISLAVLVCVHVCGANWRGPAAAATAYWLCYVRDGHLQRCNYIGCHRLAWGRSAARSRRVVGRDPPRASPHALVLQMVLLARSRPARSPARPRVVVDSY